MLPNLPAACELLGDKGYDSDAYRAALIERGITPCIPPRARRSNTRPQYLPFEEWTETFGTERLTGALLDRLTHHVNILEMNGESYRLNQSRAKRLTP